MKPVIKKERIYVKNGKLMYTPTWNRIKKATDVRWCKINPDDVKKAAFKYHTGLNVFQIVKKYKADLGFNFPFFYVGKILGDSEDQDKVISAAYGKMLEWKEFAFADGKFMIGQINSKFEQDFLVQGAPLLVDKGIEVWSYYTRVDKVNADIAKSSCQRTFVGIDKDGHLICAWADGRARTDKGLTLEEMAKFMIDKGAMIALNGDGGGSTTVATQDGILNANRSAPRVTHHAVLFWF